MRAYICTYCTYICTYVHTYFDCKGFKFQNYFLSTRLQYKLAIGPKAKDESSSMASFRFEDGVDIWDDLVGVEDDGASDGHKSNTKGLPHCAVRIHVGSYKAFVALAQTNAAKKYAAFLGRHWKGSGSTSIWRGRLVIVAGDLTVLAERVKEKLEETDHIVLGMGVVHISASMIDDLAPDTSLMLDWLKKFSEKMSELYVVLHSSTCSGQVKDSLRAFQFCINNSESQQVWMPFLMKRLDQETFHLIDADGPRNPVSARQRIMEIVTASCMQLHTCMCTYVQMRILVVLYLSVQSVTICMCYIQHRI